MRHILQWFIHLRAHGLRKGDEHPAYTPHGVWHTLPLLASGDRRPGDRIVLLSRSRGGHPLAAISGVAAGAEAVGRRQNRTYVGALS